MSTAALETVVDVRRTRLELLLKVLDVDGALQRVSGGWASTGEPWTYDSDRYVGLARERVHEQHAMLDYHATTGCRMAFLQKALDDDTAAACGRCDRAPAPWCDAEVPDAARRAANARLAEVGVQIEPRSQWPSGMARLGVQRQRPHRRRPRRSRPGRAVGRFTDLGWGQRIRSLLEGDDDAAADDGLRQACVGVLRDWDWAQRPVAVVTVPSRRQPTLVRSVGPGSRGSAG